MSTKKKVLIVEDEQDVLTYLTALFEDNGYDTVTALDGLQGYEAAKSEHPDLITLDIAMPNQSGVRTYRQYKKDSNLKDIPVIIVTAVGDDLQRYLKKTPGFLVPEGFMNKPIDEELLVKMADELTTC